MQSAPRNKPPSRSRLHWIYLALALFDLLTVSLSLVLFNHIINLFDDSVQQSRAWADRLSEYSLLSRLAAEVNAPGNEVFESHDLPKERRRLEQALSTFHLQFEGLCRALTQEADAIRAREMTETCNAIGESVGDMVQEAELIFANLPDDVDRAGAHMARMDRHYAAAALKLASLGTHIHDIQQGYFARQAQVAKSQRRYQFLLAGLILVMVFGVTLYGHQLAMRMRQADRQAADHLAALAESEARLQSILDNTPAVVTVKDEHSAYTLVNRRFEELFGVDRNQIIGQSVGDLFPQDVADALTAHDQAVLKSGSAMAFEEQVPHDGQMHTYLSVKFPLVAEHGRPSGVCGISTDITGRKSAELELARHRAHLEDLVAERTSELEASHEQLRLSERMAAIGTLAAGLGHDMNNILFPVRCRLDALQSETLPEGIRRELMSMRQALAYLQQLSDGLRLLALDPDEHDDAAELTDLLNWWDEVRPLFRTALGKQVQLEHEFAAGIPPIAVAPHRLTQALFNLIINAGEAINGQGTVRVRAELLSDRRFIRLSVTDDGRGMPAEVRRQALDPFFTTKKRALSTGLGLTLVHGVAQSTGGTVDIDSEPDRGCTVTLTLPTAEDAAVPTAAAGRCGRATVSLHDRRTATLVRALLEAAGFETQVNRLAEPGDVRLWVTEAIPANLDLAGRFLQDDIHRRVIVFGGDPGGPWQHPGYAWVDEADGFAAIQQAIATVLSEGTRS